MPRPHSLLLGSLLLLLSLPRALGCTGGQSGTESGGGKFLPPPDFTTSQAAACGCALADAGVAVRATVLASNECGLRARVDALLASGPMASGAALAPGDELGGLPLLPCARGLSLAPGDEVLLVHVPGPEASYSCPERLACEAQCPLPAVPTDGGLDAAALDTYERCVQRCGDSTADACAEHVPYARLHGQLLVAPWAPTLHVSSEPDAALSLPREQLALLVDPAACAEALYPKGSDDSIAPLGPAGELVADGDGGVEDAPACGAQ